MKKILILLVAILAMAFFVSPAFASDYGRDGPADFLQSIQKDISADSLLETGPVSAASGTFMPSVTFLAVVGFDTGDEMTSLLVANNYKNNDSMITYRDGSGFTGHSALTYSMARHVSPLIV